MELSEKSEPLLLNLLPVVSGGGLQNALSFVRTLGDFDRRVVVICRAGSKLAVECSENKVEFTSVSSRFDYELRGAIKEFGHHRTCFTLFGSPLYCTRSSWNNVCGVAFSNLFYPELDFWGHLSFSLRKFRHVKDKGRKYFVKLADSWIFETEVLATRAVSVGFPAERVFHVPMAVSKLVSESSSVGTRFRPEHNVQSVLYLAAAHPNKRQHLLPAIAKELQTASKQRIRFITTMDTSSSYAKSVLKQADELGVSDSIVNIGPVAPSEVGSLIESVDAMVLFSLLESFSNNFVEAWQKRKPLMVTQADWAVAACGDGAAYTDPALARESASHLLDLLSDQMRVAELVQFGSSTLSKYPTAMEKTSLYFNVVDKCSKLGKCPERDKKYITF